MSRLASNLSVVEIDCEFKLLLPPTVVPSQRGRLHVYISMLLFWSSITNNAMNVNDSNDDFHGILVLAIGE